ncbi:unnamed protein product, partial [marine sediment metagenome]
MKDFLNSIKKLQEKIKKPPKITDIGNITKNRKLLFTLIISIAVIIVFSLAAYYYFFIYLRPNFNDFSQNYVSSNTPGPLKPGDEISYIISFKNTGNRTVDKLKIQVKIPLNTTFTSSDSDVPVEYGDGDTLVLNFNRIEKNQSGKANFTVTADKPLDNGTSITLDDVIFNYIINGRQYSQKITSGLNHIIESRLDFSNFGLKVVDENGGDLKMGDIIKYTITVKNSGDMNAT